MKTRNTAATHKKTTPPKKTAVKSQPTTLTSTEQGASAESPATLTAPFKSSDAKPSPLSGGKQSESADTTNNPVQIQPPQKPALAVAEAKSPTDADIQVTMEKKPAPGTKTTRRVVKRVIRRTVVKPISGQKNKSVEPEKSKENDAFEAADQEIPVKDGETVKDNEISTGDVERPAASEEPKVENVEGVQGKVEESSKKQGVDVKAEELLMGNVMEDQEEQESSATYSKPLEDQESTKQNEKEELMKEQEEQVKTIMYKVETLNYEDKMEEGSKGEMTDFDGLLEETDDEKIEGITDQDELGQEEFGEDDIQEQSEEVLEEEHVELNAAAKEHKLRKDLEIFVGGLDRNVTEEDLKKVFQHAGEVVEVRLYKDPSTNKNKGYGFVKFATKEQVNRALSEMKNPVIRGKRCGIAPTDDNDTLFLGNICNTWTRDAIKQKLKEYCIEDVEKITLVTDPKHEGLSRGFAFLEFSCHEQAMLAYKRLQKPDAVFGHSERTVKVGFAEPLREPDPEVMAQVKSVFVDGLPPHWDEDRVRETFKRFGEIVCVMLARNMITTKRKDFGFVDFTSHEAAVACIEAMNDTELGDGNSKTKVRARLSNPLRKLQAVKGGVAGGFRITQGVGGTSPRFGKGFGRGGRTFNRSNFHHGRGFYPHGPGRGGRMGFLNKPEFDNSYPFHGRQSFRRGGRWSFGRHQEPTGGPLPNRPNMDRIRHGVHGDHNPLRRQSFPLEEGFHRPYYGRHFDDNFFDDDTFHGMKRPYFMTGQDPDYVESSTSRPRFENPDASASFHGTRYRDFGADGELYQQDYYGSNYGGGPYPPFYGGDRAYGCGYHY